jgi:hypothetical protein
MLRAAVLASTLLLVPAVAHADLYLTGGVGPTADLEGDFDRIATDGKSGRIALGKSWGAVGIEGGFAGFGLADGHITTASVAVRLTAPVSKAFSIYALGGLEHAWLDRSAYDLSGNGYLLGAGVEYAPRQLPVGIWGEIGHHSGTLEMETATYHGSIDTLMIGLRLGL